MVDKMMDEKEENEEESETDNTKTWAGNLGEEHSEEVNLNEITMQTGYEDDEGNFTVVADLSLIDQDSSLLSCFSQFRPPLFQAARRQHLRPIACLALI